MGEPDRIEKEGEVIHGGEPYHGAKRVGWFQDPTSQGTRSEAPPVRLRGGRKKGRGGGQAGRYEDIQG